MSTKAAPRTRDSRGFSHSHGSRLSLDPDHHVTEAIGDMYGEFTDEARNRYSYIQSTNPDSGTRNPNRLSTASTLSVPGMHGRGGGGGGFASGLQTSSNTPPGSPTMSLRSASPSLDAANNQFAMNDIDYESDPVVVAQEISNLQALRRMSMDVTSSADPDLPSFNTFVPSTPPDDNGDPGSVFWVPARLHPELAPQEFSAYLEAKKNEIRRPTRDGSLSPDGSNNSSSTSLRRKKSMLSRQIDDHEGGRPHRDGADRLEKRMSLKGSQAAQVQLDDLMKDPSTLMQKLNIDSQRRTEEGDQEDDMPIIPAPKVGLRRSTATHYRKGSLRRGERVGSTKRLAMAKAAETDPEDSPASSPIVPKGGFRLDRVQTEPLPFPSPHEKEEPRSSRRGRISPPVSNAPSTSFDDLVPKATAGYSSSTDNLHEKQDKHKSAPAKARRSSSPKSGARSRTSEPTPPVPKIVETPPPIVEHPERHSSYDPPTPGSLKKRPPLNRVSDSVADLKSVAQEHKDHMPVPSDKKERKRPESGGSSKDGKDRKPNWAWLPGYSAEKEREKEERKEREREEKAKAKKEKRPKSSEKHDNTRLDVLQKSIEMGNSGKVVAADPVAAKVDEREQRKSRTEDKKDSIFSFFGSSRKKSGDHGHNKKGSSSRGTSPDPPREKEQPPFYYSRFPIHIERAIYRLSHLKLANPRRPLHQQVLLSNFMYSYLAKVQQTQPHLIQQATTQPEKKQSSREQSREQPREEQRGRERESDRHGQQRQNHHAEQDSQQYYEDGSRDQNTDYVDDSYEYDDDSDRPQSRQAQYNSNQNQSQNQGNSNGYYEKEERGRRAMDYSNGPTGGSGSGSGSGSGGNGKEGYYSQKGGRSGDASTSERERDDMW
ncbi:hypothetical protein EDC01DRAFT_376692 [Geopyxis carbonaria]|nr:hypothetical protein EDC01DRAFT_376692 [Geopyxis carbonaria]